MVKHILVLMIAGMLGVSSATLSWANEGDAAPLEAAPAVSGETSPDAVPPLASHVDEAGYLIGPGDVLDISVWKDEALTRSCVVRPDGLISFPLVGDFQASGKTAAQLKEEMEERLVRYVPQVNLSVDIKQINSLAIYVIGKVNNPGRIMLNVDVDVLQALATAGGLNVFAKRNRIKIFRQGLDETTIFPFEYDEVVEGNRLEQNIHLRRGDVIVVP
jgi:polysaccharide export outer membrane protein